MCSYYTQLHGSAVAEKSRRDVKTMCDVCDVIEGRETYLKLLLLQLRINPLHFLPTERTFSSFSSHLNTKRSNNKIGKFKNTVGKYVFMFLLFNLCLYT